MGFFQCSALSRLSRLLSLRPAGVVSTEVTQKIQISQLDNWVKISFVTVPAGLIAVLTLYSMYWAKRDNLWLLSSMTGLITSYIVLIIVCYSWKKKWRARFNVVHLMQYLLGIRLTLASFWAFGIISMMAVSDPLQRSVLYGASIGLISTSVFGGPAIYALSFWLPTTLGAVGALFATGSLIGLPVLVCLLAYAVLTFCAILYFDRQLVERSLDMIRMERHAETIGILLHDFEEGSSDWLWEIDATLTIRHASSRFAEVAGRECRDMEIELLQLLAFPPPRADFVDQSVLTLQQHLEERTSFRELVVPAVIRSEQRWWALTGKPLFDCTGEFIGYRGVGSDVTTVYRSSQHIAYLAGHDTLTELANRASFNDALSATLNDGQRQNIALCCLDLDEFKSINDTYGHSVGDTILRVVGQRLRGILRESDLAARLGGDEFAVLAAVADKQEAMAVAERVVESFKPVISCGQLAIKLTVSVGVAVAPSDGDEPELLYRHADLALYRAKSAGRGTWRLFDADMDRHLHEKYVLQQDLRTALERNEMFVEYQPIVDLATRKITALEALVRWRHTERGIIEPADFVPLAEESGLISEIGMFVLAKAAALVDHLPPSMRISVNMSPVQLHEENLGSQVLSVLDRFGASPDRIEFEVTESAMLETSGRSLQNLHDLRRQGHRIAIDDFGTGYSSLATLHGFPFDRLKIDRGFIDGLEARKDVARIVRAIIGLGLALGISVTAEGVETERQAAILQGWHCCSAQGFFFSRPLDSAQVLAMLASIKEEEME